MQNEPKKPAIFHGEKEIVGKEQYDGILDITILTEVADGWNFLTSKDEKTLQRISEFYKKHFTGGNTSENADDWVKLDSKQTDELSEILIPRKESSISVSVNGFFDRGKTFLLNRLTSNSKERGLPSGRTYSTKGLSIKVPDPQFNYVLLDTAGPNSPVSVDLLETTKLELVNRKELEELPPFNPDDYDQTTRETKARERDELEFVNAEKIRKRAMVNKKATEQFIQELVFNLSDAIIFVVNEMTWVDQQTLEALSLRLDAAFEENPQDRSKFNHIIVIHNFKSTTSDDEFLTLRKKYVLDCYKGTLNKIMLSDGVFVERYETNKMIHLFLAKESTPEMPSPAGDKYNACTLSHLRNVLTALAKKQRDSYLNVLSSSLRKVLSGYFASGVESITYHVNSQGAVKIKATAPKNAVLKLIRDEIEYDGLHIILAAGGVFKPHADVSKDKLGMTIIMDLPGFIPGGTKSHNDYKSTVSASVDLKTNEYVIKGQRELYYLGYNSVSEGYKLASTCIPYIKNTEGFSVERKSGDFERRFKIPPEYTKDKKEISVDLRDGRLQVFIPRIPEDEEDDEDVTGKL